MAGALGRPGQYTSLQLCGVGLGLSENIWFHSSSCRAATHSLTHLHPTPPHCPPLPAEPALAQQACRAGWGPPPGRPWAPHCGRPPRAVSPDPHPSSFSLRPFLQYQIRSPCSEENEGEDHAGGAEERWPAAPRGWPGPARPPVCPGASQAGGAQHPPLDLRGDCVVSLSTPYLFFNFFPKGIHSALAFS